MNRFTETYHNMSKKQRVQAIAASAVSIVLIAALPVAAWFGNQRRIIKLQKIQEPNMLFLSAAHHEDKMFFKIDGIDVEEEQLRYTGYDASEDNPLTEGVANTTVDHKDYVFGVTGDAVSTFTIQLAYTTNNPFTYEIYAANEYSSFGDLVNATYLDGAVTKHYITAGDNVNYVKYPAGGVSALRELSPPLTIDGVSDANERDIFYYTVDVTCPGTTNGKYTGTIINSQAKDNNEAYDDYFKLTYPKMDNDQNVGYQNVQKDAIPLYWQATGVRAFRNQADNPNKEAFTRNFILRIKWTGAMTNTSKETDIVYISVKATS